MQSATHFSGVEERTQEKAQLWHLGSVDLELATMAVSAELVQAPWALARGALRRKTAAATKTRNFIV
jgi:hypothetical protein